MPQFTFFKISGQAAIPSFDIEHFETVDQAERHAASMLAKSSYEAIEVCHGDDCALIKRPGKDEGGLSIQSGVQRMPA
jgi:hypothetical protein